MTKWLIKISSIVLFLISTESIADNFLWDLTKDMTKAVAVEVVRNAVANKMNGSNVRKSEKEIARLNRVIYSFKSNNTYSESRIKELEDELNAVQATLSKLKSGSKTIKYFDNQTNFSGERWFVILGSYLPRDYKKASKRKSEIEGYGFVGVEIYDTNEYPNLKNDLYIVNIGPLSKPYAAMLKEKLVNAIPDTYIKSGW